MHFAQRLASAPRERKLQNHALPKLPLSFLVFQLSSLGTQSDAFSPQLRANVERLLQKEECMIERASLIENLYSLITVAVFLHLFCLPFFPSLNPRFDLPMPSGFTPSFLFFLSLINP